MHMVLYLQCSYMYCNPLAYVCTEYYQEYIITLGITIWIIDADLFEIEGGLNGKWKEER